MRVRVRIAWGDPLGWPSGSTVYTTVKQRFAPNRSKPGAAFGVSSPPTVSQVSSRALRRTAFAGSYTASSSASARSGEDSPRALRFFFDSMTVNPEALVP
jgi:hypothetical protein